MKVVDLHLWRYRRDIRRARITWAYSRPAAKAAEYAAEVRVKMVYARLQSRIGLKAEGLMAIQVLRCLRPGTAELVPIAEYESRSVAEILAPPPEVS